MPSHWPTDLEPDGTAPVSINLVASGDEHLMRQAMYQLQAGTQLQDRGFTIKAFQVPLAGKMVRITVPIAATTPAGEKAAVYTQSEEWTPERVADLRAWIANLREETDISIIVASRLQPPDPAPAPEVAQWLHLPYDTLNKPAESAPASAASQPLMPCLKEAKWQGRETTVCRALWEKQASQYMPWVAVGYDYPHTFEFINTDRLTSLNATEQELEAQALANLRLRPATWVPAEVDVRGRKLRMLTCSGDYFAAEHILDPAFMQEAQRTLKAPGLFVGIPRRGLMMATAGGQDGELVGAFGAGVAGQFSRGETALISPMLFAIKDGVIVGILEAVAETVVPDGEPKGPPEEAAEDDPDAPYLNAIVVRNDRGTEDVHLLAGGADGLRLAKAIERGFMALMKEHMLRDQFSGHIHIVVLDMTPPAARKQIPSVLEHLRGTCNELSRTSQRSYRVSLTFQRETQQSTSNASTAAATASRPAVSPAADAPKPRRGWTRAVVWAMVVGSAALGAYLKLSRPSIDPQAKAQAAQAQPAPTYADAIDYQGAQLSRATKWERGGTSGAVYVPSGEALPGASLQVGIIVSHEHPTANALLTWIRQQAATSRDVRSHESGTSGEACVAGISGGAGARRMYMALQLCTTGDARAACAESDRVLDEGIFTTCLNHANCFDEVCDRRWIDERDELDRVLAGFVAGAPKPERDQEDRARAARMDARVTEALAQLASRHPMAQCDAALELGRLGARDHVSELENVLSSSSYSSTRGCAADALVMLGETDTAMTAYSEWITGSDKDLYRSAIAGFGKIGPPAAAVAVPYLEQALQSSDPNAKYLAERSLSQVRPAGK